MHSWTVVCLSVSLSLSSSVSAFTQKPKSQTVEAGAIVVFEAQTEKENAKVRWQRDTKDITGSNKYTISEEGNKHLLTIGNVTPEDAGGYAVVSGSSKVKFELKIKQAEGGSEGFWYLYLCSPLSWPHFNPLRTIMSLFDCQLLALDNHTAPFSHPYALPHCVIPLNWDECQSFDCFCITFLNECYMFLSFC